MPTPHPAPRETVPSFLSRLAASKGVKASDFAQDMGMSLKRIVLNDPAALKRLAHWGNLSPEQLAELVSWSGELLGKVRMRLRGEVFVSRALRNPVVHGCPACLREEALTCPESPLSATVMRGDWQMREMTICLQHKMALVPLWRADHPTARNEIDMRLASILPSIISGQLDGALVEPSAYDRWLSGRLVRHKDESWLGSHNLHAATTFCRLLGMELMRLSDDGEKDASLRRHSAHALGFAVAQQGEGAIRAALHDLAATANGFLDEPQKAFGYLWKELAWYHLEDETFAEFTRMLRDTIFEIWPVPAGEAVLGKAVGHRELHSVLSAAKEVGIEPSRLRPLLVEAGAVAADDPRPDSRTTFNAAAYAPLLAQLASLVPEGEMRAAIGATEAELKSLEEDGVLVPRTRLAKARLRWLVEDGVALIEELAAHAVVEHDDSIKWETIQMAKTRSGVSVGRIISGIREKRIRVRMRPSNHSYHGFLVSRAEFDKLD